MSLKRILNYFLVFLIFSFMFGCGGAPSGGGTVDENVVVSEVKLVTTSSQLGFNEETKIDVYLYTQSGALYKGEKTVLFSLDKPSVASVEPTAFKLNDGHGKVTFRSRDTKGYVVVTAAVDSVQTQITVAISDSALPSEMALTGNPETIYAGGTTSIRAELKDSNGLPVENGTIVSFTLGDATMGNVTASAATTNGVALATFSSSGKAGFAKITAKVGTLSKDIDVEVKAAEVNSIIFIEANPQVISIQGTGKVTTSNVTFNVLDSNGDNVSQAVEVVMTLDGPGGGEFLGTEPGTKSLKVNTVNGVANVLLNSGTVPGTVTITAQIVGTDIKSSSGIIAIGGGIPSAGRFSLSTTRFNYEGLIYDGVKGDLNVLLADRYGNTNILANTVVKFFSECGGIEPAAILDATGSGKVEFRTQRPTPYLVNPSSTSTRQILEAEYDYLQWFDSIFKTSYSLLSAPENPNPRDGFCTITAVVDGEEEFNDINGNGQYDLGEPYTDTYNDVFEDADDDFVYTLNSLYRYDELTDSYINYTERLISESDFSKNGIFDSQNGEWDGNKKISKKINLIMSGYPRIYYYIKNNQNGFLFANHLNPKTIQLSLGQSATLYLLIADENLNAPIGGTKVDVSAITTDSGAVSISGSQTSYTFPDVGGFNYNLLTYTITSEYTPEDNTTKSCLVNVSPKITYTYGGGTITENGAIYLSAPCAPNGN